MLGLSKPLCLKTKGGSPQRGAGQCGESPNSTEYLILAGWVSRGWCYSSYGDQEWCREGSKPSPQVKACDNEDSRDALGQFLDASPGRQGTVAAGWSETFIAGWFLQLWNLSCPAKERSSRVLQQYFFLSLQLWVNPAWFKNILMEKRCKSPYWKWIWE